MWAIFCYFRKNNLQKNACIREFPESVFWDREYFRHVSSSIPSGSVHIPTPERHLSHPRHCNWACCIGKKSDQWRAKIDRQKDVRLEKTRRVKRGQSPRWTRIRMLEILFGLGMPIYRLPLSPLRSPPGYVTPRKNAPIRYRPNCWG